MIRQCFCSNPFQDSRYGKGNRVFTGEEGGHRRCTSCGKEAEIKTATKAAPTKKGK